MNILIMQNDLYLRQKLISRLVSCKETHYQIDACYYSDTEEAKLNEHHYDVIIVDLAASRLADWQRLARINANKGRSKVLVISSDESPQVHQKVRAIGVDECIDRSLDFSELTLIIAQLHSSQDLQQRLLESFASGLSDDDVWLTASSAEVLTSKTGRRRHNRIPQRHPSRRQRQTDTVQEVTSIPLKRIELRIISQLLGHRRKQAI